MNGKYFVVKANEITIFTIDYDFIFYYFTISTIHTSYS